MVAKALSKSSRIHLVLAGRFACAALLIFPLYVSANEVKKGYDIASISDESDDGYAHSTVEVKLVLRDERGRERTRDMKVLSFEKTEKDVGDKSLIVFNSPRDVKGTVLLSHVKILEPDDQWLYLPALKRVKRISSSNKSGAFLGSEFSFEDFTLNELEKFEYRYLEQISLDGRMADIVERSPRYKNSGYSRQKVWFDVEDHQIRKVEFYDRKDEHVKTLMLKDYRHYGDVMRPHKLEMVNHITGKATTMIYDDYDFETSLKAKDFEQSVLSRLR